MRSQRGQTLIMVAVMMLMLLGFVALAVDGGLAYLERRQMRTAADAGALAAARELCLGNGEAAALAAGLSYCVTENGADSCDFSLIGSGVGATAEAVSSVSVPAFFANVFGVSSFNAGALARGKCSVLAGSGTLLPMGVHPPGEPTEGMPFTLYDEEPDPGRGAFGFLNWSGKCGGTPYEVPNCNLKDEVEHPETCSPFVRAGEGEAGDLVCAEPGNPLGSIRKDLWDLWGGKTVLVPIYNSSEEHTRYHIIGIGAFTLTGVCIGSGQGKGVWAILDPDDPDWGCEPSEKKVRGAFEDLLSASGIPSNDDDTDYGAHIVHLVE